MLFVCLSHFAANYLALPTSASISPAVRASGQIATVVAMTASPSFVTVSGIVIGYLGRLAPTAMPELRRKLIDRGLFLLLIGHVIQVPAYAQSDSWSQAMRISFITDVIAVAIIIGPTLLMRTSSRARLHAGVMVMMVSWVAAAVRSPTGVFAGEAWRYLFGRTSAPTFTGFPLIPWLGVYLLATVLGERLAKRARTPDAGRDESLLLHLGAGAMAFGLTITIVRHALRAYAPTLVTAHNEIMNFFAVNQKFPPGPVYLLLFGGAGLILIAKSFSFARSEAWRFIVRPVSAIGRASFFVFLLQGYVYYLVLPAIDLPFPQLWPLYYLTTILLFVAAADVWNSFDANRYLSVGMRRTIPIIRAFRSRVRTALVVR